MARYHQRMVVRSIRTMPMAPHVYVDFQKSMLRSRLRALRIAVKCLRPSVVVPDTLLSLRFT